MGPWSLSPEGVSATWTCSPLSSVLERRFLGFLDCSSNSLAFASSSAFLLGLLLRAGGFLGWEGGFFTLGGMLTVYYRKESRKVLYKRLYKRRGRLHLSVATARWTTAIPAHPGGSRTKTWWGNDRGSASGQNSYTVLVLQYR